MNYSIKLCVILQAASGGQFGQPQGYGAPGSADSVPKGDNSNMGFGQQAGFGNEGFQQQMPGSDTRFPMRGDDDDDHDDHNNNNNDNN
jgi:hypothetical protein